MPDRAYVSIIFWMGLWRKLWKNGTMEDICLFPVSMTHPDLSSTDLPTTELPPALEQTVADLKLSDRQYQQKMQRRKEVQSKRLESCIDQKGLIIVNTGNGKGKTTAALGMVLRSLGHGFQVAIIQYIKGAWEPAEKAAFAAWGDQLTFHAMGEGFTWETQDRDRDIQLAQTAWQKSLDYIQDPNYGLVLLDEVNIALKLGYLQIEQVLKGLTHKPANTHVILTGRGAPQALIDQADLVTEMTLVKHPFKSQGIKAQAGIEF